MSLSEDIKDLEEKVRLRECEKELLRGVTAENSRLRALVSALLKALAIKNRWLDEEREKLGRAGIIRGQTEDRLALLEKALRPFAELGEDLTARVCHVGICSAEHCRRCSEVFAAREALAALEPSPQPGSTEESFSSRGIGMEGDLLCLVCGAARKNDKTCNLLNNIAAFVSSRESGARIVKILPGARLDYREREPEWIQVKVGACDAHLGTLEELDRLTISAGKKITLEIVRRALTWRPEELKPEEQ